MGIFRAWARYSQASAFRNSKHQPSETKTPPAIYAEEPLEVPNGISLFSNQFQKCTGSGGGWCADCCPKAFLSLLRAQLCRAHGVTRDAFATTEGGMARILICIMNRVFLPFFVSFSLLYTWQMAFPVKPLFVKGGDICFYSPYTDYFKNTAFLRYIVQIERNNSPITTWLQLLTNNPHLDEAFCEEKDKKILLSKQPPDYCLSCSVLLSLCSLTWEASQRTHGTRGFFF